MLGRAENVLLTAEGTGLCRGRLLPSIGQVVEKFHFLS